MLVLLLTTLSVGIEGFISVNGMKGSILEDSSCSTKKTKLLKKKTEDLKKFLVKMDINIQRRLSLIWDHMKS